jgi:protein MpaA
VWRYKTLVVPRHALLLFVAAVLAAGCRSAHLTLFASRAADAERLSTRATTAMPPQPESNDAARERAIVVGRSRRGRTITARVLGPDSAPRKILLVGCIHGNECAGIRILSALARVPPPAGIQLWLVPEMNPDGAAARTRQNADGVDLNRNFPYHWQPVSDPTYYSGPHALSEPETRAAVGLIRRTEPVVTIWYHQHEDLVDMAGGDRGIARRYAELAGLRATCLPFLPGTASSWSNHTYPGTTAFVVELPPGAVGPAALRRHLRALRGIELGERVGSGTGCGP